MQKNHYTYTASDWRLVLGFRDGHKYFRCRRGDTPGGIGVADQSGHYPHETEDGVLWLDQQRPVLVDDTLERLHVFVPLRDDAGNRSTTPVSFREAVEVVRKFGMKLRARTFGFPAASAFRNVCETDLAMVAR